MHRVHCRTFNTVLLILLMLIVVSCKMSNTPTGLSTEHQVDKELLTANNNHVHQLPPAETVSETAISMGIGLLSGPIMMYNNFARNSYNPFFDTVPIYDSTYQNVIGGIPKSESTLYTYGAYVFLRGKNHIYYNCDADRLDGMSNLENSLKVFAENNGYINLLACRFGQHKTWIKPIDLGNQYQFIRWIDYFKKYPKGNQGWQHGYEWIGGNGYSLRYYPFRQSLEKIEINPGVEIYLLEEYQRNWAKVLVKEVEYKFGEMYFQEAIYGNEWTGWMKIVSDTGHPLLQEVILGC